MPFTPSFEHEQIQDHAPTPTFDIPLTLERHQEMCRTYADIIRSAPLPAPTTLPVPPEVNDSAYINRLNEHYTRMYRNLTSLGQCQIYLPRITDWDPPVDVGLNSGDKPKTDYQVQGLWLEDRPENTRRAYMRDVQQFDNFMRNGGCRIRMADITLENLHEWVLHLLPTGIVSERTRNRKMAAVKSLFSFATKIGHLKFNVAAALKIKHANSGRAKRTLSKEEVLLILTAINDYNIASFCMFMYLSGLRLEEAIGLKREHVKPRPDISEHCRQITVVGKGNKERTIVLNDYASKLVSNAIDINWREDSRVFLTSSLDPITPSKVWRAIRRASRGAGITKPVSAHWFRHAHASHALEAGVDINLLRESLGHESINTTAVYLHAQPNQSSSLFVSLAFDPFQNGNDTGDDV